MAELKSMMNIGKEMEKKLVSIGIESSEELIRAGAIHNIEFNSLSDDKKKKKEFSDFLKK